jgi:CDP-glycerol glycerophosphotransferase
MYWHKRPGQKYLMLWHGGVALKKIEKDAEDKLRYSYVQKARIDSKVCDLMISGCSFQTKLLKDAFWYSGEILEKGIPRCDIFFDSGRHKTIEEEVRRTYSIPAEDRIVLYAPTFRADHSIEPYRIDWGKVIPEIDRVFGGTGVTVLLRLHPNLIGKVDTSSLTCFDKVIDVTRYPDMQGLLCITDMLITDYSSSMFDIGMLRKPCVLYATDIEKYNRGYYFRFDEMPFPLARNEQELLDKIGDFSMEEYLMNLDRFYEERIGMVENGTSSKALSEWMTSHSM